MPSKRRGRRPRFIGIYEIKCIYTNRVYIGSSKDICIRWNSHIWDIIQDKHVCKLLKEEVKLNGISSIIFRVLEVLDITTTPKVLRHKEQQYMNLYTKGELLNTKRAESINTTTTIKPKPLVSKRRLK